MKTANEKALEEGPLERLFGNSAMAKILDFLTLFKEWDYSKTDIAKHSGVNRRTVLRLLPRLEERKIVKKTRNVGKATMYQLNKENPIAQVLNDLAFQIATYDVDKMVAKELEKPQAVPASS